MTPSLADLTTLRVGGPAREVVVAEDEATLLDAVRRADASGTPALLVGGGSNLVVPDAGYPGTVVVVRTRGVTVETDACAGAWVTAAAGEPWGVRASVPAGFNRSAVASRLVADSCARVHARHSQWKTVAEWRAMGIQPLGSIADDTLASLFEPDGPGTAAYLLTGNYRVILQYNCSNYYALSVGLLADEIAR